MAYKIEPMYLTLSLCDEDGQFEQGISLAARSISLHMLDGKDMVWDIIHTDGEHERVKFLAQPGRCDLTRYFKLGTLDAYIVTIGMCGHYPPNIPISKDAFRARCGTGRLLNKQGHFA
jgi:hypothetical protein